MIAHLQLPNPCILLGKKRLHFNYISPHPSLLFRSASSQPLVYLNIKKTMGETNIRKLQEETIQGYQQRMRLQRRLYGIC